MFTWKHEGKGYRKSDLKTGVVHLFMWKYEGMVSEKVTLREAESPLVYTEI